MRSNALDEEVCLYDDGKRHMGLGRDGRLLEEEPVDLGQSRFLLNLLGYKKSSGGS